MPVDGEVIQGASTITIEHLTGESKPLEIKVGDTIPGGARNLEGMLIIKVCFSLQVETSVHSTAISSFAAGHSVACFHFV